jgi:hypothetical protein
VDKLQRLVGVEKLVTSPPRISPTDLCRIAPEDTRVTMRPDPDDTGRIGAAVALAF